MSGGKLQRTGGRLTGPWADLQDEVNQFPSRRNAVLKSIERELGCRVVALFTAFNDRGGMLTDDVAEMLENVVAADGTPDQTIALILNSPGGQALAAERIANVCRAYSKDGKYRVVVPHMAKSAATMVCFGASEILMSKTAELGPVDPQVSYADDKGNSNWISAAEYVRSYDKLMDEASSGKRGRIEPYLQQLQRYDARYVEQLRTSTKLSSDISVRLLSQGMLDGVAPKEIEDKIEMFLSQEKKNAHGRMITAEEAIDCGLNVKVVDLKSELWKSIWTLYVRMDHVVTKTCNAVVESATASVRK